MHASLQSTRVVVVVVVVVVGVVVEVVVEVIVVDGGFVVDGVAIVVVLHYLALSCSAG